MPSASALRYSTTAGSTAAASTTSETLSAPPTRIINSVAGKARTGINPMSVEASPITSTAMAMAMA